jgi:tetratricopeptide (TPR) repeat protein
MTARAQLADENGDRVAALAAWSAAIAVEPKDPGLLAERGIEYVRAGQNVLADKDFLAARALASDATSLNNMCWKKATAGVALQSALEECDLALAKVPDAPAYLDSKALVLLRLGRVDDAIAVYGKALERRPRQPSSLFGRVVAWTRKGDKAKADADAAAALKADPDVRTQFEGYGIRI